MTFSETVEEAKKIGSSEEEILLLAEDIDKAYPGKYSMDELASEALERVRNI